MIKKILLTLSILPMSVSLFAADGIIKLKSNHSVKQTANKLEQVLLPKGMKIFQRVKHSDGVKPLESVLSQSS